MASPDGQGGPDGPLRVVLAGDRGAEQGHDGVPDELLDRAAVAFQLPAQAGIVGSQDPADVLDVELLGPAGEADQVAEQDADDLALVAPGRGRARDPPQARQNLARAGLSSPQRPHAGMAGS
jgi:hypothetical protein